MEEDFTLQRLYKQNKVQQKKLKQLKKENEELKQKIKELERKRVFPSFTGWTLMKAECIPIGQMWINPNDPALKAVEAENRPKKL